MITHKKIKSVLSIMKERICKFCKEIITEDEFEKLKRNMDHDMTIKSKHWGCYLESRANYHGVGIK